MPEQLHFRLYAPLASWGDLAVGENRTCDSHPTRSGLLGLLAAAVGVPRGDEKRLRALSQLGVAMRVDQAGTPLHDYHTAQAPRSEKKVTYRTRRDEVHWNARTDLGTILSSRAYRQDVLIHVAIIRPTDASEHTPTLETLHEALLHPHHQLYLGRRSCPLGLPLAPRVITASDPATALRAEPPESRDAFDAFHLERVAARADQEHWYWDEIWECQQAAPATPQRTTRRHDAKTAHAAWLFAGRDEYAASISTVAATEEGP